MAAPTQPRGSPPQDSSQPGAVSHRDTALLEEQSLQSLFEDWQRRVQSWREQLSKNSEIDEAVIDQTTAAFSREKEDLIKRIRQSYHFPEQDDPRTSTHSQK